MNTVTQEKVAAQFGNRILETTAVLDELTFVVERTLVVDLARYLRDEKTLAYLHLSDITATDWPQREKRFEVVYHLYSLDLREYVRIKTRIAENDAIPTLCGEWDTADWLEREVYDMFGVRFEGHPDLRRILMWEGFEGYPLRKDYPLTYELPQFTYNKDAPPEVIK